MLIEIRHSAPLSDWLSLVKKITKDKKMSRSELSDKTGISRSYLSEIFSGKKEPRLSKVISIMLALGIFPQIELKEIENEAKS